MTKFATLVHQFQKYLMENEILTANLATLWTSKKLTRLKPKMKYFVDQLL